MNMNASSYTYPTILVGKDMKCCEVIVDAGMHLMKLRLLCKAHSSMRVQLQGPTILHSCDAFTETSNPVIVIDKSRVTCI
jgi:hypothetical protein